MALQNNYKAIVNFNYENSATRNTLPVVGRASNIADAIARLEEKFTTDSYSTYPAFEIMSIEYLGWEIF